MTIPEILQLLKAQRDRLDAAILALQGAAVPVKRGRRPKETPAKALPAPATRTWTPEQRAEQARRIRAAWAAKKAGTRP